MFTINDLKNEDSLKNDKVRICLARMLEYFKETSNFPLEVTFISKHLKDSDCFALLGVSFEPNEYLDAMPSFPVFTEFWPGCWGLEEDMWKKRYVINPRFLGFINPQNSEEINQVIKDLLRSVEPRTMGKLKSMSVSFLESMG